METFGRWFTYTFQSVIVDLCGDGLVAQEAVKRRTFINQAQQPEKSICTDQDQPDR